MDAAGIHWDRRGPAKCLCVCVFSFEKLSPEMLPYLMQFFPPLQIVIVQLYKW